MKYIVLKALATICATLVMALPAAAGVVTITDLFNTGVDNAGNAVGSSVADSHYSIVNPGFTATTVATGVWPLSPGPWVANNSTSRWIGTQNTSSHAPDGASLTFRTTFTIGTNADLTTVLISGSGAADNSNTDTILNGVSLGSLLGGFTPLKAFTISNYFILGTNTLDFVILNACCAPTNPVGLRIDGISGSYMTVANNGQTTNVPEPSVFALFALGLMGFGLRRFRK